MNRKSLMHVLCKAFKVLTKEHKLVLVDKIFKLELKTTGFTLVKVNIKYTPL